MGATLHPDGRYSINCSARKNLPDITFTLAGHNFSIGPEDYVFEYEGFCISVFFGNDFPPPGGPFAVLGTAFLRKWYSVFDVGANTISFARAKQ
jgi:saccharopepsin